MSAINMRNFVRQYKCSRISALVPSGEEALVLFFNDRKYEKTFYNITICIMVNKCMNEASCKIFYIIPV